ncbi:glyoxalase [Agrobacterium rhizogenes]|uniref:VOC family protein n=1 Tax=Rhizobium rhizogenes TaxID=359 RepID=UPI00115D0C5C|nr:VOC family protein [Rhizobium rhizogenes]NTG38925.1 glyoxalase [Rhizobium rhizogenes]NTG39378.1 glyoxalase [Rhizobium rhizogenes]NTG58049.1 glyoxalase [Rhizobium rhizogenes]NTG58629.1 glyoxalase [Rhizobium rhizogenes]NTI06553.1 glyoxalase [Rhizobium rhizogenes]
MTQTVSNFPIIKPYSRIDHIALAVRDLDQAISLFRDVLGFELKQRRHIKGKKSGMVSAEMEANGIRFVLCQGTEPESQVSQLVENFGVGIAHVALEVDDVAQTVQDLKGRGLAFDTDIIAASGLSQAFSTRCHNTGMSFEIIHRDGEDGFLEANVQELFDQLEKSGKY